MNILQVYGITYVAGPEGWKVPSIRPLETLHNSLTLRQMENFLKKVTEVPFRTPVASPPPGYNTPRSHAAYASQLMLPIGQGNNVF